MSELEMPSGPWTGFYNYRSDRAKHRMDLTLSFGNSQISGEGCDDVGPFVVAGRFDLTSGECYWTKTYVGAHDVFYRGFREQGKGIWGLWELESGSGGFHIWPLGEEQGEDEEEQAEEPVPANAVAAVELRSAA